MKEIKQLRKLSVDELNSEVLSLRKEQFTQRMKRSAGSFDKPHLIKNVRRAIARAKTIITEKGGLNS